MNGPGGEADASGPWSATSIAIRWVDLLPDRSVPSIAQWLQAHPSVEIVCRDRSRLYAEGIRLGAPQAVQVVDRLHMVQDLRVALERFFLRYRRELNTLDAL
jgi:transposase